MKDGRVYNIDYEQAFNKAVLSAKTCFELVKRDASKGIIECTAKTSIWSWGESISINVKKLESRRTRVTIDSSPAAQLFDWGKSKENIMMFFAAFESE